MGSRVGNGMKGIENQRHKRTLVEKHKENQSKRRPTKRRKVGRRNCLTETKGKKDDRKR